MFKKILAAVCALSVHCTLHTAAVAQTLDELGNRASAIGAFVAVADDSAATAWNPAGLVNGPFFNIALDFGQTTVKPDDFASTTRPAGRHTISYLSAGVPPFGLSYFRGRQIELSPAVSAPSSRQDRQVVLRELKTSHLGVTVLQSLADGVTVGATARLVRGSFASGTATIPDWDAGFDRAEVLDASGRTTADVDVGALVARGQVRIGMVARNLAAPTFVAADGDEFELARHLRVGMAWSDTWPGQAKTILSVDADLTRVAHAGGERRDIAAGAERWFRTQSFAIRGGLRASTVGDLRPVASVGGSYAVRRGIYVDALAAGGRGGDRRWGIAGRLMY